ncbi:Wsv419 [Caenorhabditis elegans]|uniref:Wsv419 n=1 Tax=Caenorhabditis elegans TaxID=6239 RepID=P90934_CAEEL|nr:Wsv419 [Caenorhabditis elegans]CAB06023.2 Wsv419 [Caenorhabditis elegans]|eukprot:NP_492492.2 Uncharacterized protein CELE_M04C9.4 [Caenorhabditis elegans]
MEHPNLEENVGEQDFASNDRFFNSYNIVPRRILQANYDSSLRQMEGYQEEIETDNPINESRGDEAEELENEGCDDRDRCTSRNSIDSEIYENSDEEVYDESMYESEEEYADSPFIIDKMEECLQNHQIGELGSRVMEGLETGTLADVQLEEFCRSRVKPEVTPREFYEELASSGNGDWKKFSMGQFVLSKMKSSKDTAWANTEATVNSLAANLSKANTVGSIVKRVISREYAIEEKDGFPRYNLTNFYNNTTLQGQGAVAQLTSVYVGFLKNLFKPSFKIWLFTYRPSSAYNFDKHFVEYPASVIDTIFAFSMEVLGVYLPEDLLVGGCYNVSDASETFLQSLGENASKEVERRRKFRGPARKTCIGAMAAAMKSLRQHHYNAARDTVSYCSARSDCKEHLTWHQLRFYRAHSGKTKEECDLARPDDVMAFCRERAMPRYSLSPNRDATS